jgi:hypothetical protein
VEGHWTYDAVSKRVIVELAQKQNGELFRLPLQIGLSQAGAVEKLTNVMLTGPTGRFEISADKEPQTVTLDPGVQILMDGQFTRKME